MEKPELTCLDCTWDGLAAELFLGAGGMRCPSCGSEKGLLNYEVDDRELGWGDQGDL
jgi:hypothetical protein